MIFQAWQCLWHLQLWQHRQRSSTSTAGWFLLPWLPQHRIRSPAWPRQPPWLLDNYPSLNHACTHLSSSIPSVHDQSVYPDSQRISCISATFLNTTSLGWLQMIVQACRCTCVIARYSPCMHTCICSPARSTYTWWETWLTCWRRCSLWDGCCIRLTNQCKKDHGRSNFPSSFICAII